MRKSILAVTFIAMALAAILFSKQHQPVAAQQRAGLTPEQIAQRNQREQELESVAIVGDNHSRKEELATDEHGLTQIINR